MFKYLNVLKIIKQGNNNNIIQRGCASRECIPSGLAKSYNKEEEFAFSANICCLDNYCNKGKSIFNSSNSTFILILLQFILDIYSFF